MGYYAHSVKSQSKEYWQTLQEHLTSVGDLAANFASAFNAQDQAQIAGLLHDLGKYTQEFQARLEGGARVDHSTWGAKKALELYPQIGQLLAYTIAGHHAGLANGKTSDKQKASNLDTRLANELPELSDAWQEELNLVDKLNLPSGFMPKSERGLFQLSLLTRMIYSCLVDADFIDTDDFYTLKCEEPSIYSLSSWLKPSTHLQARQQLTFTHHSPLDSIGRLYIAKITSNSPLFRHSSESKAVLPWSK